MIFVPFLVLSVSFFNTSVNLNQLPVLENKSNSLYAQASTSDTYSYSTKYYSVSALPAIQAHKEQVRIMQEAIKFEQAKSERDRIEQEIQSRIKAEEDAKALKLQQQTEAKKQAQAKAAAAKPASQPATGSSIPSQGQSLDIEGLIRSNCEIQGCDSNQLIRVMYCESGGRTNAYNKSGASGVFQFMPRTFAANAKRAGVENPDIWNGEQQVRVAAWMFARNQAWQWVCK